MTITLTCTLRNEKEIACMLQGLTSACEMQIREGGVPLLYESGVRYEREPVGRERWQTCRETMRWGSGDCEDLVAWRVAELRVTFKERAEPAIKVVRPGLIHCVVLRANGMIEDPSRALGMKGKG